VGRLLRSSLSVQVIASCRRVAPGLTAGLLGMLVVQAAAGAGVVLAIGSVVGKLPAAIRAGPVSAAAAQVGNLLVLVAAFVALQQLLAGGEAMITGTLGRRVEGSVRGRVMASAMAPDGGAHLQDPEVRSLIDQATTLGTGRSGPIAAVDSLVPMSSSLLSGLAMCALVAAYRWWLGLALAAGWLLARRTRMADNLAQAAILYSDQFGTRRQAYFRELAATPGAAKEIRVFGLGGWLVDRFHSQWLESVESLWATRRRHRPSLLVPLLSLVAVNLVAFGFVAHDAWSGRIHLRAVAVLLQAIVASAAMSEPGATVLVDTSLALAARSMAQVSGLEAVTGTMPDRSRPATPVRPLGDIVFDRVSFAYPGQSVPVLDRLSVTVPAGRSLAIVGVNGSGKTTLVKLLCGLLEPNAGELRVDGLAAGGVTSEAWRSSVAVVWQDFVRLQLSARENVGWGAIDHAPTTAGLSRVAARAGLTDVVAALPDGWDTPLSGQRSGGVDLSGGEWQRIALARALLAVEAGASVLVLDEPTANLDVRAEAAFYEQFLDLTAGLTTLVISHRFSTVRRADLIGVLSGGRIAELGRHDDLMAMDGTYARLFRLQAAGFDPGGEDSGDSGAESAGA
jgi:ATP-binding cassette subfamily B protein